MLLAVLLLFRSFEKALLFSGPLQRQGYISPSETKACSHLDFLTLAKQTTTTTKMAVSSHAITGLSVGSTTTGLSVGSTGLSEPSATAPSLSHKERDLALAGDCFR